MKQNKFNLEAVIFTVATVSSNVFKKQLNSNQMKAMFAGYAALDLLLCLYFYKSIVEQMTKELGIECFSLKKRAANRQIQESKDK